MNHTLVRLFVLCTVFCSYVSSFAMLFDDEEVAEMDKAKKRANLFSHGSVVRNNLDNKMVFNRDMLHSIETRLHVLKNRLSEIDKEQDIKRAEKEKIYEEAQLLQDIVENARRIIRATEKLDRENKSKL